MNNSLSALRINHHGPWPVTADPVMFIVISKSSAGKPSVESLEILFL